MNKPYNIIKSINILNCLLLLTVAAAAYTIANPAPDLKTRTVRPAVVKPGATTGTERAAALPATSPADYALVSEQNLFHPERRIPPDKIVEPAKTVAVIPKPDLVLYGTLIADDLSIAYIEDKKAPTSTPGRGKRQQQLKKGDSVSGYVLREIEPNRIVLFKGEEQLVVLLDNKNKIRSEPALPATGATTAGPAAAAAASRVLPAGSPSATASYYNRAGIGSAAGVLPGSSPTAATSPANPAGASSPPAGSPANPQLPTPTGTPGLQNLPARSRALSDMLSTTPAAIRGQMSGK